MKKIFDREKMLTTASMFSMADAQAIRRKQLQWQYQDYMLREDEEE